MRQLPERLPDDGLLVGWSLEAGRRKRGIGFRAPQPSDGSPAKVLEPILDTDEGHLVTVAPTGAGKGTGAIIPALLRYQGPVVVVDPKGENYAVTAERRRQMGQEIILLDPFNVTGAEERHRFNPLDLADPRSETFVEDVSTLANLASKNAVGDAAHRDPFWPQMGQTLVTAALLDVLTMPDRPAATLPAARAVVNQSIDALKERGEFWERAEHPELRRMAGLLGNPAEATMGGYWALAVNQLDFLKGVSVEDHLTASDLDLNKVLDGSPLSIYLVLPPDKLESHAPLLRLWIGTLINVMTRRSRRPERSTLMLVDEAAQLGELPQLRQAMTLLRGYGVRVWSFWQDLSQMRNLYPRDWETLLNNCRVQQYFGTTTAVAADAVVEVTGFGPREAVLELNRDEMLLNVAGDEPVVARKPNYRFDAPFQGLFASNPFYAGSADTDDGEAKARPVFRRSEPFGSETRSSHKTGKALEKAGRMFHPVPRKEWEILEGEERKRRLRQAGISDPAVLADRRIVVRSRELPFYSDFDWYHIADTRQTPTLHGYYVMGERERHAFHGTAELIHEVNEQDQPALRNQYLPLYVEFFLVHCVGSQGRFLVVDSVDEIEWHESPDESFLDDLRDRIGPPRLVSPPAGHAQGEGLQYLAAELVYGDSLFTIVLSLTTATGQIDILTCDPLAEDLSVLKDTERLPFIGAFDNKGCFLSVQANEINAH